MSKPLVERAREFEGKLIRALESCKTQIEALHDFWDAVFGDLEKEYDALIRREPTNRALEESGAIGRIAGMLTKLSEFLESVEEACGKLPQLSKAFGDKDQTKEREG